MKPTGEREAFNAWAESAGYPRNQAAWLAWQARATAHAALVAERDAHGAAYEGMTKRAQQLKDERDALTARCAEAEKNCVEVMAQREELRAKLQAAERAGNALAKTARSLAGDVGTYHDALIWQRLAEWDAALAQSAKP